MATPSHVDLSVLWVPIMPETSKMGPALEQAGKDAKGKFGQAVKGIADPVQRELSQAGTRIGPTMEKAGHESKNRFAQGVKGLGDHIHNDLVKAGDKTRDIFTGLGRRITSTLTKAGYDSGQSLSQHFADASQKLGGISGAIDKVGDSAKNVGVDLGEWTSPLQDAISKTNDVKGHFAETKTQVDGVAETLKGLPGVIGRVGEAIGNIAPQIAMFATIGQHADQIQKFFQDHGHFQGANPPGQPGGSDWKWDWFHPWDIPGKANAWWPFKHDWDANHPKPPAPIPGGPPDPNGAWRNLILPGSTGGGPAGGPPQYPSNFVGPIPPGATRSGSPITQSPPSASNFYKDWYAAQPPEPEPSAPPSSRGGGGGSGGGTRPRPSIGGVSSRADLHAAGSRVANLFAFAQSLVGTPYSQELRNDCSGMVAQLAAVAIGLPPPSAGNRFSTPNEGDWLFSHGFQPGLGGPNDLNIGWNPAPGNSGHTAATLPGGINAESGGSHGSFLLGAGAAGANDPFFTQHAHLSMGAVSGKASYPDSGPVGTEHDPIYVSSADKEAGGSGSPFEQQGQQLAQGMSKGFLELFGIDGSVFKGFGSGKSPLDFGIMKLGGGLLNWIGGLGAAQAGASGSAGATGGDGAMRPGLGALIPNVGAAISASAIPRKVADAAGGGTTINNTYHGPVGPQLNVTQNGAQSPTSDLHELANGAGNRLGPMTANLPTAGG